MNAFHSVRGKALCIHCIVAINTLQKRFYRDAAAVGRQRPTGALPPSSSLWRPKAANCFFTLTQNKQIERNNRNPFLDIKYRCIYVCICTSMLRFVILYSLIIHLDVQVYVQITGTSREKISNRQRMWEASFSYHLSKEIKIENTSS